MAYRREDGGGASCRASTSHAGVSKCLEVDEGQPGLGNTDARALRLIHHLRKGGRSLLQSRRERAQTTPRLEICIDIISPGVSKLNKKLRSGPDLRPDNQECRNSADTLEWVDYPPKLWYTDQTAPAENMVGIEVP